MRPGRGLAPAVRQAWLAALLLASACVTTYEAAPLIEGQLDRPEIAVTQAIPFGTTDASPEQRLLVDLYSGIFARLEVAAEEGDAETIDAVLASYDVSGLPEWVAPRFAGYRALANGLRFLRHAKQHSQLTLVGGVPPLDGDRPLVFQFTLPAGNLPAELGARGDADPCGFAVRLTVEDWFLDGSFRKHRSQQFIWPPSRHELTADQPLTFPIQVELPPAGAITRTVTVRVFLLPGYVRVSGERAAVRHTVLASADATMWPKDREAVLADPLGALAAGLREGTLASARQVWMAALAVSTSQRDLALQLLMDQVRGGTAAQAHFASAALAAMTGESISVGDRDAWLAWWQARR